MNGEQTPDMKDIRTDRRDTVPDTFKTLSSPHFDELAVAAAQPVKPLPPRRNKLLRSALFMTAYLAFIVAIVGLVYLAPPKARVDASTEATTSETQTDTQSAEVESSAATTIDNETMAAPVMQRPQRHLRRASRLRFQRPPLQIVEGDEGKPISRKVGEIRYGRSPDRP
jgi:hypothetical protein